VAGQNADYIKILGSSDLLRSGSRTPIFPRDGEQQSDLSVAWGAVNGTMYNGDYSIARLTVSNNSSGPIVGYVLSNQVNNLNEMNYATLSFNNGQLIAAPGSEFALLADANRDNQVNSTDFTAVAQHFSQSNTTWSQGDFNGDGNVNALDFNSLANNFGANPAAALGTLAPEPTTLGLLMTGVMLMRRRRRLVNGI
jgi:hypothetical protein